MNKITKVSTETASSKATALIEEILYATRDMTGAQAATIVGIAITTTAGACYVANKISGFIQGNHIKEIDFANKTIIFNNPSQIAVV